MCRKHHCGDKRRQGVHTLRSDRAQTTKKSTERAHTNPDNRTVGNATFHVLYLAFFFWSQSIPIAGAAVVFCCLLSVVGWKLMSQRLPAVFEAHSKQPLDARRR